MANDDPQYDEFDPVWYLQNHADVREAGLDPWDHYRTLGRAEGRQGAAVRALELDHMLWRGYADTALPALETLLAQGSARERAVAGWALARWRLDLGDLQGARAAILAFHEGPAGLQTLRHPGPFLLGVQCCLRCGDPAGAEQILAAGLDRFGPLPDFALCQLLLLRFLEGDDWELSSPLARLHGPHGLAPLSLDAEGTGPRFDRLQADPGPDMGRLPEDPPKVSIIVPVYNAGHRLRVALRGLQAQSWPNLEIIIVDDGSSDDSLAVAKEVAKDDPRLTVIAHAANQGAYPARNTGFAAATGAFITVHDADDWSHPQKIEQQVLPLLARDDLQATVSHWVRVSDDLDMTRWRMEDRWVYRNVSSLMIRAGLRDTLGYWDRVTVNADTEYYYRVIAAFGAEAIQEVYPGVPLAFGRTETQSLTNQSATHLRTQFGGVRRDYMEAAHDWHARQCLAQKGLYLPQHPEERPFRAPAPMGVGDPDPAPSDFDILTESALFDADWYRLSHPDVLAADMSPVRHYLSGGARENRDPGPGFSSGGYRIAQDLGPDLNPLLHYETEGRAAGAAPLPRFPGALDGALDGTERASEGAGPASPSPEGPCVLIFAHTSGKTLFGAERSLLGVVERIAQRGLRPVVVLPTLRNPTYLQALRKVAVAVESLPQIWRHALRPPPKETVTAIRQLIDTYKPREIHVNTLVLDAPLVAARAAGVPSVVHVRELPEQDVALCRQMATHPDALRETLLAQADRFVVTSTPVAAWLAAPERTVIRPNSVDPALFDMWYAPKKTLNIGLISSNIAKKGLADFIAIARRVAREDRPIRFRLIGPPTRDLHLMQPLPRNVEFRGYSHTPVEAMGQCDVVMSLSKFAESFGRTVMEAMAAGRPVICYDRGAPPSLFTSGQEGFVVPADDLQAAANVVLALDAARGQLDGLSRAARVRARALQEEAMRGWT